MPTSVNAEHLFNAYLLPWGIHLVLALAILILGRWLIRPLVAFVTRLLQRSKMDAMLVSFVGSIVHALLMLLVIIAALDRLGVDTTSLVALIGAAGLAVGLALQGSLQNFAAGVMLVIFRPFKVGDYIEAASVAGTVETIGIFSTTLRTPDNRNIVVPNGQLYSGTITNNSARDTRRIDLVFGIGYGDDLDKARQVLQALMDADARILKEPAPVIAVAELAASSVDLAVRPWVKATDYGAVRFDLLEGVKRAFDANGISIPYPQSDVHLHRAGDA
jgi:small conductance mechanosensitive channel